METVERSKVVNVVWPDATSKEEDKKGAKRGRKMAASRTELRERK